MSKYTLEEFEGDIAFFNEACGVASYDEDSKPEDMYQGILRQYNIIQEELHELKHAAEMQDETEMLDAVVDILFTSLRLVSLLDKRYDVMDGCKAVAENNALKYTSSKDRARQWQMTKKEKMIDCELVETNVLTGYDCGMDYDTYFCIKNAKGKVLKYEGFPQVDLSVMKRV